jgi:hypothetical protein
MHSPLERPQGTCPCYVRLGVKRAYASAASGPLMTSIAVSVIQSAGATLTKQIK